MSTRALKAVVSHCRGIVLHKSFAGGLKVRYFSSKSDLNDLMPVTPPPISDLKAQEVALDNAIRASEYSPVREGQLQALLRLPLQFKSGDGFLKPHRLTRDVLIPYLNSETVYEHRKPVIRTHLGRIYERWEDKNVRKTWCGDKMVNPLYATQASPGMGKSALIDQLSSLSFKQVRELSPTAASDEFCHWVVDSVHVNIDLKSFQTLDDSELVDDLRMIAIRLLHSYFAGDRMGFREFREVLKTAPEFQRLSIGGAMRLIRCHRDAVVGKPAPSFFIYIDEFHFLAETRRREQLAKMGSISSVKERNRMVQKYIDDREMDLMMQFAGVVTSPELPTLFISTLNDREMRFNSPSYRRPIWYLKLDLVNGHELFKNQTWYDHHPSVRQMVAELGGHPRSLVRLGEVLESAAFTAKYSDYKPATFEALFEAMEEKIVPNDSPPLPDSAMDALVTQCLLGKLVSLDWPVVENGPTHSFCIAEGYLLHSASFCNDRVVATMAPIVLRKYLMRKAKQTGLHTEIDRALWAMLRLQEPQSTGTSDEDNDPKPIPVWRATEKFHALFEVLRSHLLAGQKLALGQLYPSTMMHPNQINLLNFGIDVTARSLKQLDSKFLHLSASDCAAYGASVVAPAASNPGCDLLIPLGESSRAGLFILNRYSAVESNSTLTITHIIKKRLLIDRTCEKGVPVSDQLKTRVLVIVSTRDLSINLQRLPPGVLVLSPEATFQMYGPMLSRMATWFEFEHRIAMNASGENKHKKVSKRYRYLSGLKKPQKYEVKPALLSTEAVTCQL